jgi:hypothetical protein
METGDNYCPSAEFFPCLLAGRLYLYYEAKIT